MPRTRVRARFLTAALSGLALCVTGVTMGALPAQADPGANNPSSYYPSDASTTNVPTYDTSRARTFAGVTNGQDFDHYCKADWKSRSIDAGDTSGKRTEVPYAVNKRGLSLRYAGDNGLLYMNQWWNTNQTEPYYRVVWATDYATKNSKITLKYDDNVDGGQMNGSTFTPYSTDKAVLAKQMEFWSGASRFRAVDWSTYVLGLQGNQQYRYASSYTPGPYTGVNSKLFSLNPNSTKTESVNGSADPFYPNYTGDYYPQPDQYSPNLDTSDPSSFINNVSWNPADRTMTINLGDQPAGAMIVFGVSGQSVNGSSNSTAESFGLTAKFTGDYVSTDPTNTVCYPTTVNWTDVDQDEQTKKLPAAQFALTPTGDVAKLTSALSVPDAVGTPAVDTDAGAGALSVNETSSSRQFQPGTWNLTQSQAPQGYQLNQGTFPIKLDFRNQTANVQVTNVNEAPAITAPNVSVTEGDTHWSLLTGVTSTDKEDGDLTSKVEVKDNGGFDVTKPGDYTVTYTVTDAGGKTTEATRVVTVTPKPANTAPTITAPDATINQGDTGWSPMTDVTGSDNEDGDITKKVTIKDDGGFDASKPGEYTITYSVTDSGGLTTEATRVVTVVAKASPVPTTSPSSSAGPSVPATPDQPGSGSAALPYTGANVAIGASIAAVLLVLGGIAFAFARRRRSQLD